MTMPSATTSARPRPGKHAFRPRGAAIGDDQKELDATWPEMLAPLGYIYRRYWDEAKGLLAGVALIVLLSSIAGIAAPYVFSRLIDTLRSDNWGETIVWAFAGYGVLFGLSQALSLMVSYLAVMTSENL